MIKRLGHVDAAQAAVPKRQKLQEDLEFLRVETVLADEPPTLVIANARAILGVTVVPALAVRAAPELSLPSLTASVMRPQFRVSPGTETADAFPRHHPISYTGNCDPGLPKVKFC